MAITPITANFTNIDVGSAATFRATINENFIAAASCFNSDINDNLTDIQSQIDAISSRTTSLETKVGNESVSEQINAAIEDLDVSGGTLAPGNIVDSWSETDGKVNIISRPISIQESGGDIACVGTYNSSTNKLMTNSAVTTIQSTLQGNINTVDGKVIALTSTVANNLSKVRIGSETSTTLGTIWIS